MNKAQKLLEVCESFSSHDRQEEIEAGRNRAEIAKAAVLKKIKPGMILHLQGIKHIVKSIDAEGNVTTDRMHVLAPSIALDGLGAK